MDRTGPRAPAHVHATSCPGRRRHLRARWICWPAIVLGLGCESDHPTRPGLDGVEIDAPDIVTLVPGQSVTLRAVASKSDGDSTPLPVGGLSWSSDDDSRTSVGPEGTVTAGEVLGLAWVFVDAEGLRDSVGVWVQRPASEPSSFRISLHFEERVNEQWRTALLIAARRWEEVIRAPLPPFHVASGYDSEVCPPLSETQFPGILDGVEDGTRIAVVVGDRFIDLVEATGGPCIHRGLDAPTTVMGRIDINAQHRDPIPPARMTYLAHHEMGHVLGLVGVVQGAREGQPAWLDARKNLYTGPLADFGFDGRVDGTPFVLHGGHWTAGFGDIMANRVSHSPQISRLTVGSLMDFGYPAAWYGAGPLGEEEAP